MGDDIFHEDGLINIGLIPDGNRRWAIERHLPLWMGHKKGAETLKNFINWCSEHPEIKSVTIFALSTDNLGRTKEELDELWKLYKNQFEELLKNKDVKKKQIKINILGDESLWRSDVRAVARQVIDATKSYTKTVLNIMLAYSSNFEIENALKKMVKPIERHLEKHLLISEKLDLIIRTGGQQRLSNFMLLQAAYSEIFFSETLWPDFSYVEFSEILRWYHIQKKRFGK